MAVSSIYDKAANSGLYTTATDIGQKASETRGKSELDMSDFMNLLVAQMVNQDIMNPVSETDFIAQMAQFSSLEGINTLQEYTLSSYAVSYTGKYVVIAHQNDLTGALEEVRGTVESVSFYSGTPLVYVDGKGYYLYEVMEVASSPISSPDGTDADSEGGENSGGTDVSFVEGDPDFDLEAYQNSEMYDPMFPEGLPENYEKIINE